MAIISFFTFDGIVTIVLGILFVITGALKIPNLKGFSIIVATYNILPRQLVKPAAYIQPFVEFGTGLWLLSGVNTFYAATLSLILMVTADVFVIKGLLEKNKMENCGCFGVAIKIPLTWKKLAENIVWTLLCLYLVIISM